MLLELAVRSRESNHYLRYHNIRLCYTWYGSLSAGGTFGFEIFINLGLTHSLGQFGCLLHIGYIVGATAGGSVCIVPNAERVS